MSSYHGKLPSEQVCIHCSLTESQVGQIELLPPVRVAVFLHDHKRPPSAEGFCHENLCTK